MAGVTKENGTYHTQELVHRDLFFKTIGIGGGAISQVEFDALMQEVHLTSTIEVIGTFVADSTTAVLIVISGADVNTADLTGAHTSADIAGF